jgi:broad specificity phosphatase PhoE
MIYLMRHAQSVVNVERRLTCHDLQGGLTARGREQAQQAAEWLRDKNIQTMYTSPFQRASETAAIVSATLGLSPVVDEALREIHCGDFDGKSSKSDWACYMTIFSLWRRGEWDAGYPGGETFREAFERYATFLKALPQDKTALVVSHAGIALAVVPLLCVNAAALQRIDIQDNTGFVLLDHYDSQRFACDAWNLIEHLQTA